MSFAQERSTRECNTDMLENDPYPQPSVRRICCALLPFAVAHRHGTAGWGLDTGAFASCCLSGRLLQTKQNIVKGLHHYFVLIHSILLVIPTNMSRLPMTNVTIQLPLITKEKQTSKGSESFCTYSRSQTDGKRIRPNASITSCLMCVCG